MKYQVIVIDPPFSFSDKLAMSDVARGADANYTLMTNKNLLSLPVKDISDPEGSLIALWVPSSLLDFGIELIKNYGFSLKQTWIWVKVKKDPFKKLKRKNVDWEKINWDDFLSFGMGRLGRNVHEMVLIGTRGKVYNNLKNKSQRTVFFYENAKHSKKPELLQDRLELMFPNLNYIEIFGRRARPNWKVIGNEAPETLNEDIFNTFTKLLK